MCFAAVIYPSLRLLEGQFEEMKNRIVEGNQDKNKKLSEEVEQDDECGICMENCAKTVLPSCGHSMCISCFHDWYLQLLQILSCSSCQNHVH